MIVPTSLDDMARRYELYDLDGNRILPQENALPRILDTPSSGQGCHGCDAYRPEPQVSGNLHVDPDTTLPTAAGPLELSWHYNASSRTNSPYGFARTVSINQTIQASGGIVTVTRGNSATVSYLFDSVSSSYKPSTPGLLYSLVADTTNNVWREYNLNGGETDFAPLNTTGQICSMVNYRDSCSNTITITYASGLPQNIEDPASRLVTLTFSGGLISSVEDWGARVTTFMFDTHSASPDNLLTTVIGPTGCTSVFGYATFALDTSIASGGFGWLLSEITDPNGYTTQYKYDRFTRVINRQIAGYPPTTYLFQPGAMITIDPLDRITTQLTGANFAVMGTVDATGAVTTITRNANLQETSRQNMLGFISSTNYDGTGNISSRESPLGLITTYTRDVYNNVTSTETPDGAIVTNVWGYAGSSFDTTGAKRRLQAQINQMGEITSFAWTGQGLLQSETSPLGTIVTHNYDSNFNRVSTQDQLSNLWSNVYDLVGNVTATENPLGARFSTVYDAQNRPTERISPTGAISTVGYDSVGNPTVSISPLGFRTTMTFNVFDKPMSVQNALNQVRTNLYDDVGRQTGSVSPLGMITTVVLDNADRMIATVNPLGFRTSTLYDAVSRPIATVSPIGEINTAIFDSGNRVIGRVNGVGAITSTIYDLVSRPVATMNPLGYLSSTVLDLVGRTIATVDAMGSRYSTTLDVGGRAIAQTDPLNRVNSTIFDAANRAVAQEDSLGYRVSTSFDNANRPIAAQDQLGRLTSAVFDVANRRIASIDALSSRFSVAFDLADRPISSTDSLDRTTSTIYDGLDRAISKVSPLGFQSSVLFDADGRKVASQDELGSLFTSTYDAASRQVGTESPLGYRTTAIFDTASRQIATQNSLGFLSSTMYDDASRPVGFLDELSNRSTVVYDVASQTIARIDALNNRVSSTFDPVGRTISAQDARSFLTSMIFDVAGQNIAVVAANGGITSTLFDQRGYVKATQDPLGALTSYTRDGVGNTVLRIDARNWPTTYSLDALNRPVGTVYIDGTRITNTFDAASQQTSMRDVTGIRTYSHDLNSRLIAVVQPSNLILTYGYSPIDERVQLIDCDSGITTYGWDAQSKLISIVNPLAERTTVLYDALDREQWKQLANGMTVSHTFDPAGRETILENRDVTGKALAVFTNSYDAVSNRLNVLELDGTRVSYVYDASYQLINEQRSGVTPYNTTLTFDSLGNRTQKSDSLTTYTSNVANELLQTQVQISTMSYQIDAGGSAPVSNFSTDTFYSSPGTMMTDTVMDAISTTGVTDPAPQGAYQSIRYVNGTVGPLVYTIPNLTPGENYRVRLHFCTFTDGAAGRRALSITINSQIVASGLDIFALAGGDLNAYIAEYVGTADGAGNIVVSILGDATKMFVNPFLNAIEVLIAKYRINSGGTQQSAWDADEFVSSAGTLTNGSTASAISLTGVTDPAPEAVYQDMVYVAGVTSSALVYTIPDLTPGANYRIRLHFATFSDGGDGLRLLTVAVNGNTLISNLDVYATAGGDLIALIEEINANADVTGTLTISITADQTKTWKNPFLNGLEIRSNGVTYLSYDQNGNLSTKVAWTGITTHVWDGENRLLSVSTGVNGIETYAYSADGLRQQKVTPGGTNNFVWDEQNILQERDVSHVTFAQYTNSPGYWGGLVSQRCGSGSSFYGFDSQSSTRILVSIGGLVTDNYGFRAFGEYLGQGGGTLNPFRYVGTLGYFCDTPSRMHVRARNLDPVTGRWLSRDPITSHGVGMYVYAVNDPVGWVDPAGLAPCSPVDGCCAQKCSANDFVQIDIRNCTHGQFTPFPQRAVGLCDKFGKTKSTKADECSRMKDEVALLAQLCVGYCIPDASGSVSSEGPNDKFVGLTCACNERNGRCALCAQPRYCLSDPLVSKWETDPVSACVLLAFQQHEETHVSQCQRGKLPTECCGYFTGAMWLINKFKKICSGWPMPPEVKSCQAVSKNCQDITYDPAAPKDKGGKKE